nr:MAG TPA: hypothetical protein [Caudoviricetes sp.]
MISKWFKPYILLCFKFLTYFKINLTYFEIILQG